MVCTMKKIKDRILGKAQYYENTVQWDACQEQLQQCSGICLSLEDDLCLLQRTEPVT